MTTITIINRHLLRILELCLTAGIILLALNGSACAENEFKFARFSQGDEYSNGPFLHGFFPEGASFLLLSQTDSKVCLANSTQQFIYDDQDRAVIRFEATRIELGSDCSAIESVLVAIQTNDPPHYHPLPFVASFLEVDSTPKILQKNAQNLLSIDKQPLLYSQKVSTGFGTLELFITNNYYKENDFIERTLVFILDGTFIDAVDIGLSYDPPRLFYLDDDLFVFTHYKSEGGMIGISIHEISPDGLETILENWDWSA